MYLRKNFPIWRDAEQLCIEIEQAVRNFPRYHKYTIGSELRTLASGVLSAVTHAINNTEDKLYWVKKLTILIEELKLKIQIAKQLKVYQNFKQFEVIARLAVSIGKQARGWLKKLQHHGQQGT